MMKLVCLVTFIGLTAADVSHLFRGNKPFTFKPFVTRKSLPTLPPLVQFATTSETVTPNDITDVTRPPLPVAPVSSHSQSVAAILKSTADASPDGSYHYAYETDNQIAAEEQGQQRAIGSDSGNVAQGSFQYISPEGVPVVVNYIADENGFQPQSDLIPTPPPVPIAILRALEFIAAHPQPEVKKVSK